MNSIQKLFFFLGIFAVSSMSKEISLPVFYHTLPNGLRVMMVRDTTMAVVSCRLYYFVGSMYEGPGTTGLSHMFEHMMFKGTKTLGTTNYAKEKPIMDSIDLVDGQVVALREKGIPDDDPQISRRRATVAQLLDKQRAFIKKDEIWMLYQNNGGTGLNAWTADNMTAYFVTLPKNKLELFLWIESDRMQNPVLREFPSERDVVIEERLMRCDSKPQSAYDERLTSLFYIAHPYRLPTIGWMSDIKAFTRQKLENHVRRYYTPDNAVIILAGNVDTTAAFAQINRYFGKIPRANPPKQEVVTREPAPIGETRFTVHADAEPRIDMLFHTPGYPSTDLYRLDVVESMLSGRSGRLYNRLVTRDGLCTDAGASNAYSLHNGYFHVWATFSKTTDPLVVERAIRKEIDSLSNRAPTASEMARIKNNIRMNFFSGLTSIEGLSNQLAWFERLKSYRDLFSYPDSIANVVPDSVSATARRFLSGSTATIGLLLPDIKPANK